MNVYVLTIVNTCTPLARTLASNREEAMRRFEIALPKIQTWGWHLDRMLAQEFKGTDKWTHPYTQDLFTV